MPAAMRSARRRKARINAPQRTTQAAASARDARAANAKRRRRLSAGKS